MTGNTPLLVGFSGKRALHGREAALEAALADICARIEAAFPRSPLTLACGLAEGADSVAAELALRRPRWTVLALLPMAEADYAATFSDAPARARLRELLAAPRVSRRVLAPLAPPRTGPDAHFEQLALFLACRCPILLAALPAGERAMRAGGTARVVRHRLTATPDALARTVLDASTELAGCPGPPAALWRIDLGAEGPALPHAIVMPRGEPPPGLSACFPMAAEVDSRNGRAMPTHHRPGNDPG